MDQNSLFAEYKGVFEEGEEAIDAKSGAKSGKSALNFFALPDSVGRSSVKDMWLEYTRARINGGEAEMLHAGIVAKVRDILLAQQASAEDLQIHPFVYKKAKSDFKNWSTSSLTDFYDKLIYLYFDSRSGGDELDVALEKLLLSV